MSMRHELWVQCLISRQGLHTSNSTTLSRQPKAGSTQFKQCKRRSVFLDEMEPKMNFWWSLMLTFLFSSCRWKLRCFLFYTRWTNMQHQYNGFFHCGIVFILIIWLLNRWTRCASIAMEQKQMWKSCWGRPRWGSRFGRSLTTHWNNCKIAYYAYHIIKA